MLRLLTAFYCTPWALDPATLDVLTGVVERWSIGTRLSAAEIRAAVGDAPELAAQRRESAAAAGGGAVAVIPVYGVLAHRIHEVDNTSKPLTSTERLANQVRQAAADPQVGTIVLDIDSPGGSAFGVQELGETIFEARKSKHIVAQVNNTAASGGYWIASQATEIVVTPSGMVGSIGVIVPHTDASAAYEKLGVKREYITYGKYKAEGNDTGPLDDDARAYLQGMVNVFGESFTKAVARGRNLPVATVRGEAFGEGRMRLAKDAVSAGMADSIGTLEETIARVAKPRRGGMSAQQASMQIRTLEA